MIKNKKLFIFGNKDYATMVKAYFQEYSEYEVVGFVVDSQYIESDTLDGLPVVSSDLCVEKYPVNEYYGFVAIGYTNVNRIREKKIQYLKKLGYRLATYIDPSCTIFPSAKIGENCFIMEQVVIQSKVIIKEGCTIVCKVCLGHDGFIDKYAFIGAGTIINGFCTVGSNCFIGANSTINNGIKLSDFTVVGAASHITKNTVKYGIYMGQSSKNIMKNLVDNKEDLEKAQILFFNNNISSN